MPPKKGKKGKKNDDDWVEPVSKAPASGKFASGGGDVEDEVEESVTQAPKKGAFGFQALETDDLPAFNHDDNGEDLGGLMSMLGKASKKKGGKKNKRNKDFDDEDDAAAILARLDAEEAAAAETAEHDKDVPNATASKKKGKKGKKGGDATAGDDSDQDAAAILAKLDLDEEKMAAEEGVAAIDKEQPTPAAKGKSNKKGGKKGKKNDFDDEEDAAAILARLDAEEAAAKQEDTPAAAGSPNAKLAKKSAVEKEDVDAEKEIPEPGTVHIKSKKEKERERKERAKLAAKKKQPTKKSGVLDDSVSSEPAAPSVDDVAPEPVSSGKGKKKVKGPSAAILAIREALAAQKAAEEQAAREAEEEEKRLADIAAREAEETRLKEEARQKKKEKEKARKEELKKAGLYMTPAQRAAQAQQKAKLEAMLASGVVVPALAKEGDGDDQAQKRKRPVYSNRKKKPLQQQVAEKKESAISAKPVKKAASVVSADVSSARDDDDEVKDSWDASSGDEAAKPADEDKIKDSWDATSSDEDVKDSWDQESVEDAAVEKPAPSKSNGKVDPKKAAPVVSSKSKPLPKAAAEKEESEEDSDNDSEDDEEEDDDSEEEDSEEEDDDDDEDSDDGELTAAERQELKRKEEAAARRQERIAASYAARSKDNLRSPICCILGHVDTGKTKLLDKIRQTNVQEGEAGGITQQIGATYFPLSAIEEKTAMIHKGEPSGYKLPGLLVIDTPGHESFTNLRSRGSSLCNIAVLVVDIVHGLEPQTIESLNMLRARKTPFIVALNKIDRLFDWETHANYPTRETLALQKPSVVGEFNDRVTKTIVAFAEQGLNACLYWENKNLGRNVSLVPTSAVTGEGVPDMLHLLMDLTQSRMTEKLMYLTELECTVLEVKVIEGLGTTIDVVLSNGVLNEGDKICVCGLNGPIVTTVRALLTPQPMRELRVKSAYQHHKTVKASLGIKIAAPDLEKAIAGSRLLLIGPDDDEEEIMEEVMGDLTNLMTSIDKSGKGVCVQSSTLGSLEALLSFLKDSKIPVSGINIGPVHKKDIIRASVMLERAKEYAQLLAFDVPIDKDAEQLAADMGVKIFSANIIYHLFDKFTAYMKELDEQKRKDAMPTAVFPCVLKMVPDAIFNKRSPIIIGVDVIEGVLKVGTPLCVVNKESGQTIDLGKVVGIELNHKARNEVKKGDPSVAIRVESPNYATPATYGRHFTQEDDIYSKISRESIDVLKTTFRNEVSREGWALVVKLKKVLSIA